MTQYNVVLETTLKPTISDDVIDAVMDGLADHAGVIGRNERGRLDLVLTVPATGLRQAATAGLAIAEAALGRHGKVASLEVMTTKEFDARTDALTSPAVPELLSLVEAAEVLGITRQAVHHRITTGALPAVKVGSTWAVVADVARAAALPG